MIAVPSALPVTLPLTTEATLGLLDDQITKVFVALDGITVATRSTLEPTEIVALVLLSVTPVTATTGATVLS